MNISAGLTSLDPALARNESTAWMTAQLFTGLVELDTLTHIRPALARRWEIDSGGRVYRFYLRKDVYFHQDSSLRAYPHQKRRVTASDCLYSFMRVCAPETASPGFWIFNDKVEGIKPFIEKKSETIVGFSIENDTTFVIRLSRPFPPFLSLLASPYGYIVPREAVELYGKDFGRRPVGSGPFIFKKWAEGRVLVLGKNKDYYETGYPKLNAIYVRMMSNKISAFNETLSGALDYIENLDPVVKNELLDANGALKPVYADRFYLQTAPQLTTEYLGFNLRENGPLKRKDVRRALRAAIDRQKLCRYLLKNTAKPATGGIIPPGLSGGVYDSVVYNPVQARKILQNAGYSAQNFPTLTLETSPNYQPLAEFIQQLFGEIGVPVKIDLYEGTALRERIADGKAQLWRASWVADYPDGENFLSLFYSHNHAPDGPNTTKYASSAFDSLYEAAQNAVTPEKTIDYYEKMERQILIDAPIAPLYYYKTVRLVSKSVKNLPVCPTNVVLPLKYAEKF